MTVRLKSKNTESETQKIIPNGTFKRADELFIFNIFFSDEDVLSKHADTSHSAISTTEFDFQMSPDKSR